MSIRHLRWMLCAMGGLLSLALVACGAKGPRLHPVRGKVFFQGQPPEGAVVVFHATTQAGERWQPSGVVGGDGTFALRTYPYGEGAPAGEYTVLITWYPSDARTQENAPNRLPTRYAEFTTPLPKVTIKEGTNELEPFQLTK